MFWTILIVAAGFVLLTLVRIGATERVMLRRKWPSLGLWLVAAFLAWRGLWAPALVVAGAGWLAWVWPPRRAVLEMSDETADAEARRVLGVDVGASASDIRAAYRDKMRTAHPDQGGSHAQAAKLAAARDRLLRKRS